LIFEPYPISRHEKAPESPQIGFWGFSVPGGKAHHPAQKEEIVRKSPVSLYNQFSASMYARV
jgi:hypothetical protein